MLMYLCVALSSINGIVDEVVGYGEWHGKLTDESSGRCGMSNVGWKALGAHRGGKECTGASTRLNPHSNFRPHISVNHANAMVNCGGWDLINLLAHCFPAAQLNVLIKLSFDRASWTCMTFSIWKTFSYHKTQRIKTLVHKPVTSIFSMQFWLSYGPDRK